MKTVHRVALVATVALPLAGCQAGLGQMVRIDPGVVQPEQGPTRTVHRSPSSAGEYEVGQVAFLAPIDVDTAYTRLKREFGFLTRDERYRRTPSAPKGLIDASGEFRYEAQPGVRYHMKGRLPHMYASEERLHSIEAVIEKDREGSYITLRFWLQEPMDMDAYGQSIQRRASAALGV